MNTIIILNILLCNFLRCDVFQSHELFLDIPCALIISVKVLLQVLALTSNDYIDTYSLESKNLNFFPSANKVPECVG